MNSDNAVISYSTKKHPNRAYNKTHTVHVCEIHSNPRWYLVRYTGEPLTSLKNFPKIKEQHVNLTEHCGLGVFIVYQC